jgi:two-component system sensor histidine kinase YesM
MDVRVKKFVGYNNDNNIPLQIVQADELKTMFNNFAEKRYDYRIRMFVSDKKIFSGEKVNFFSVQDIMYKQWYENIVEAKGRIVWVETHRENYVDTGEIDVISCARVLKHSYNYEDNDGILLIDIPESNISSILASVNIEGNNELFIANSTGKIISSADKSKLKEGTLTAEEIQYINSGSSGIKKINKNGRELFLIYHVIDATGWKIAAEIEKGDITKSNLIFSNISILVAIVFTFIIFASGIFMVFAYVMANMNKQVKYLVNAIEKEGVEVIGEGSANAPQGDLTRLEKDVFNMMQRVKKLMDESYEAKIREREAQLKALQAQINPHFLYNTLDAINWMAVKIKAPDISFMVNSLARYFRLSLSKGKSIVSIKDELELINVYLTIQQKRFKGGIQFKLDIEEAVENYNIHKLTLQPIVENAIIHGIQKNKDRSGLILIEAKKVEEDIIFTITDNGVGMGSETVEKVLNNLPDGKEGSYGLYNVNERIKLYFGEGYGIKIHSEKGVGTKVKISIKAI